MNIYQEPKHDVKFFKEMIDNAIENGYRTDLMDDGPLDTWEEMLGHFEFLDDEDPETIYLNFLEAYMFHFQ